MDGCFQARYVDCLLDNLRRQKTSLRTLWDENAGAPLIDSPRKLEVDHLYRGWVHTRDGGLSGIEGWWDSVGSRDGEAGHWRASEDFPEVRESAMTFFDSSI